MSPFPSELFLNGFGWQKRKSRKAWMHHKPVRCFKRFSQVFFIASRWLFEKQNKLYFPIPLNRNGTRVTKLAIHTWTTINKDESVINIIFKRWKATGEFQNKITINKKVDSPNLQQGSSFEFNIKKRFYCNEWTEAPLK